ncbi:MAG: SGNH/GDSL hydrolase family protein [Alcanivorax sp.]|uniref:SGNH/GDSL hydrolase family protein n=1 Tax=Alloalcanivorax marinus TaxID=1177169 RepID=A0A9Q3ULG5_9GAMM|nr:SGNH/GDSL hydrolase family protein [Alloalcanivorax marinus]MCC4308186.1 SGNH/GDSL hydrolase family protein [Alloalcanivorax marinus]
MRFWLAFVLLAPLLLWQGRRARRDTPRLPEAGGADHGRAGAGDTPLRLLLVGESTAVGVGVREHHQGLGGQLARALHRQLGRPVTWRVDGVNGIRAAALATRLADRPAPDVDLVVVSLGVNDTTGLTSPRRYQQALGRLIATLRRKRPHLPVALLAVPPMQHFTALPRPLRDLLGARAGRLDRAQQALAARLSDVHALTYPAVADPSLLAEDGYHPGEAGYAHIADRVAPALAGLLR